MSEDSLTIRVQGHPAIVFPISQQSYIDGKLIQQIKIPQTTPAPEVAGEVTSLRLYDPGFKNTIVSKTEISLVDGENGTLLYRGYNVEELVEHSSYLETAYLLIYGSLPTKKDLDEWLSAVMNHTFIHTELSQQMTTFRYDAHPMGMFISAMASLSTFHPEANPALQGENLYHMPKQKTTSEDILKAKHTQNARNKHIFRILGKASTIASNAYRHRIGRTYNDPMPNCLNYCENILFMMDKLNEKAYVPHPKLVKLLDKLFIVLSEHGSNCSTVTMRHLTSSGVDPYTALSGSMAALFGERKCHSVIDMLEQIKTVKNIPLFMDLIKRKETDASILTGNPKIKNTGSKPLRLMGFGHRIYKSRDPRVKIVKEIALQVFDLVGKDEISELALELEIYALTDEFIMNKGLFPNVDYWTAIILHTLGFPKDMFPVWLALPRIPGFLAHWMESLDDPEYKIYRPRQIYIGPEPRVYEQIDTRYGETLSADKQYITADPIAAKRRTTGSYGESTSISNEALQN